MKIYRDLATLSPDTQSGAVAIGNFDGVHRGHARIAKELVTAAQETGGPAVVFTFEPHPVRLLRPAEAPPPLTWTERKAELLQQLGVDCLLAYPTDQQLLQLTPADFFQQIVCDLMDAKILVEGPNFRFGQGREGDIDTLHRLCASHDRTLRVVEPVREHDQPVSSSRIRELIASGEVAVAAELLGYPYRIRGLVTHGAGRGAQLGYPTANLAGIDTLIPPPGVYAGRGYGLESSLPAAINVGPNPTFGEQQHKVEVHLIGGRDALYGQLLEVDFRAHLRDIRRFASTAELQQQLAADCQRAAELEGDLSG